MSFDWYSFTKAIGLGLLTIGGLAVFIAFVGGASKLGEMAIEKWGWPIGLAMLIGGMVVLFAIIAGFVGYN